MVSHKLSISFRPHRAWGLVAGLYLFTRYALRLAALSATFTSD